MTKIDSKDISVVVQGPIEKELTKNCLISIRKFLPEAEIILSSWENSDTSELEFDRLVLSNDPGNFQIDANITDNTKRQLVSAIEGIKCANRKYILKIRSDIEIEGTNFLDYFDKYKVFLPEFRIFKKRILINSYYTRNSFLTRYLFHPSDWIMFGLNEDISKLFDIPIPDYLAENDDYFYEKKPIIKRKYTPEQYMFAKCLYKNHHEIKFLNQYEDLSMEKRFLSENYIMNNFAILDYKTQFQIEFAKYQYDKHSSLGPVYANQDFLRWHKNAKEEKIKRLIKNLAKSLKRLMKHR